MKTLYLSVLLLILSGCFGLNVRTEPVEQPRLNLKNPDPINLEDITFVAVTKETLDPILQDFVTKGNQPIILGMSVNNYRILALNIEQIKAYIILLQTILDKYRNYYEPPTLIEKDIPFTSVKK